MATARPKARVKIEGLEELQAKLRDPRLIGDPFKELLKDASQTGQEAAERGIDGGTGIAVRTINRFVDPTSAKVTTVLPRARAMSIEKGRPPGEEVPVRALVRWLSGNPYKRSADRAELELAYQARAAIKQHGAKGKRFMQQARQAVADTLPRLLGRMARRIERMAKR